jgi:predicted metalloprotease with PDZ domain
LRLVSEPRQPISIGISADEADTTNFKIARVRPNSPAAEAGWDAGDKVLSIGGIRITPTNFLKIIGRYKPGDRVNATLQRGARTMQTTIVMGEPTQMNYRIEEIADAPSEAKALRVAWTTGK